MRGYKTKRYTAPLAAAMAALLALSGCGSLTGRETEVETVSQAIEVHTATAGYGTIDRQTQFVGRVEAAESVKVYATTSAKVIEANAAPGERVEKGQLLFALDTEMLEIAAETSRLQYEAALSGADMTITSAKKAYDNAREGYHDLWEAQDEVDFARSSTSAALRQATTAYNAAKQAVQDYLNQVASGQTGGVWDPETDTIYQGLLKEQEQLSKAYQTAKEAYDAANKAVSDYLDQVDNDQWDSTDDGMYQDLLQQAGLREVEYQFAENAYNVISGTVDAYPELVSSAGQSGGAWDKENDPVYQKLLRYENEAAQAYQAAQAAYQQASASYEAMDEQIDNVRDTVSTLRDTYRNTAGDEEAGIVGTAQSQVDLARISYDNAVKNLNDARVYAPVSGIVSVKNVSVSDFASPGVPLYVIEPEGDAPVVSFNLSEDGANALSVGSPVTVIYNGAEYPAAITELANTANPQTGLYAAKAQTDQPLPTSRSGGVVKVQASTAKAENELLLSLDLLEYDGNQPYVYVYKNGVAARVDVVTGISSADDIVILSGLTEDDRIITTWHPDLKDGAAVTLAE